MGQIKKIFKRILESNWFKELIKDLFTFDDCHNYKDGEKKFYE